MKIAVLTLKAISVMVFGLCILSTVTGSEPPLSPRERLALQDRPQSGRRAPGQRDQESHT